MALPFITALAGATSWLSKPKNRKTVSNTITALKNSSELFEAGKQRLQSLKTPKSGLDYIGVITPFFCHDGRGNFLFYKRGPKSKDEVGKWDCSGGSMKRGEQPEQSALRKLKEQFGCDGVISKELQPLSIFPKVDGQVSHFLAIPFIIRIDPRCVNFSPTEEKIEQIGWYRLNELPTPLHPGAREVLLANEKEFQNFRKKLFGFI
ncbi:hypothetical protein COW46_05370 [Candidatus Gracilibacteria bacterium CG17_big_fil_post_rev_8_21_14_2_50_48_13]|nr:MAG: hypothetical protein COW46_05370 [Candidatus Gracilibacteria bacterium CG17_big_fil_post_rev_8_21_14_2_50_48_13]